jgi:hypothetical protein
MASMKINVLLFCCLVGLSATAQEKEGFELVKKDGDITVYERWIDYPNSNPPYKAREVLSEFYFNSTMYKGLRLMQDEEKIYRWQNHVTKFEVYKQPDSTIWHEYSYHDIPWPVSDQDHYLVYTLSVVSSTKLFVTFASLVDAARAPVNKSVTRMELSGSWTFEQLTPTRTKVTYRIISKPIGIPKWLTDPIIRSNIMTTMKEYIDVIEGRR